MFGSAAPRERGVARGRNYLGEAVAVFCVCARLPALRLARPASGRHWRSGVGWGCRGSGACVWPRGRFFSSPGNYVFRAASVFLGAAGYKRDESYAPNRSNEHLYLRV